MLLGTAGFFGLVSGSCTLAAATANAQLAKNYLQGAKAGERGLEEIEPHKSRKPQPIWAVIMGQHQAKQHECARESTNNHFHAKD
jgi:hypothetical protein